MSIQELVLDFLNVKGQELSSKVEDNQSIEADLQQINDMWNNVQDLVTERTKDLKGMVAELSDFEEDLGRLGDVLNHTEVCLHESESTKVPGYNGLQNQLAKLKVKTNNFSRFEISPEPSLACVPAYHKRPKISPPPQIPPIIAIPPPLPLPDLALKERHDFFSLQSFERQNPF